MIFQYRCVVTLSLFWVLTTVISSSSFSEVVAVPTSPVPQATGPATRPRIDDLQKESSSFVADPDPLDPLPLKKESLKEDEEPVLEDIRQILNAPVKKIPAQNKKKPEVSDKSKTEVSVVTSSNATVKKSTKKSVQKIKIKKKNLKPRLLPDDPDQNIENAMFQKYKKFNLQPTSAEQWAKVTSDRKVETFIVEKGNTLESISRILFGDSQFWPKIWALNHSSISNPHFIYPGMKIYFYPATATDLPSMNIGAPNDPAIATSGLSLDGRDYTPQQTDFEKFNIKYQKRNINTKDVPQPVPESIPIVRSKDYFQKLNPGQVIIDLKPIMPVPVSVPENPYLLSADQISTDYSVPADQIDHLLCRANQLVPVVQKVNLQATPGKYLMLEPLQNQNYRLKKTFVYKIIGEAEISDIGKMRIKVCKQLMNSETVIVSAEKIQNLSEPTETFASGATLVESLESPLQDFFSYGHLVVLSTGSLATAPGQNLNIYSESEDTVVGEIQVIKITGTLAIGYLTKISQLIQIGDQVQSGDLKNDSAESTQPLAPDSELSL
jgi:hypothetical protein